MIKGIIFDIDGVLLDSNGIWKDLGTRYLNSIGVRPEEGLNDILFSMSMEQGAGYLKEQYDLKTDIPDILSGISGMLKDFYFYEAEPKKGAEELLKHMKTKGLKITAATSSPRLYVEKALERIGMLIYLEKIFTNSEIGASKHSPDIFNSASGYMGTKPEETLVFEDSLYALKTAKAAGYMTVGVYDGYGETDQEGLKKTGDYYIADMDEFQEIFETKLF